MNISHWFRAYSRSDMMSAYLVGFDDGRDAEQRRILAENYKRRLAADRYPNARDVNVVSITCHPNFREHVRAA